MVDDRSTDVATTSPDDVGISRRSMLFRMGATGLTLTSLPALLAACGSSESSGSSKTLRIGLVSEMDSLNPFVQQSAAAVIATHMMFPTLTRLEDPNFTVEPDLAESYEVSGDGKRITFTLKTNGTWSDGKPITTDDVAFTINTLVRLRKGAAALLAQYVIEIDRAEAVDETTVVVHYHRPIANALGLITRVVILPKHVWEAPAAGDGAGLKSVTFDENLVCGGQFKLRKYAPKQIVLLDQNDGWYGAPQQVTTLGFQTFGAPDAMLQALETNEIDAVALLSPSTVGGPIDKIASSTVKVEQAPGFVMNNLYFNVNPKKPKHRELLDPEVRRALSMAIDRERIVRIVLFEMGVPAASLVYPAMGDWHDDSITPDPFDVAAANALLDELGYERGSDGTRMGEDAPMSYTINLADGLAGGSRIVQIISDGWAELGVKTETRALDAAAMIDAISAPDGQYLDNAVAVWGFLPASPDPSAVLQHFVTDSIGGFNNCHYSNPEYDELYVKQNATLDVEARRRMVYEMQRIFFDARAMLALCYVDALAANGPSFTGYQMSAFGPFNAVSRNQISDIVAA